MIIIVNDKNLKHISRSKIYNDTNLFLLPILKSFYYLWVVPRVGRSVQAALGAGVWLSCAERDHSTVAEEIGPLPSDWQ